MKYLEYTVYMAHKDYWRSSKLVTVYALAQELGHLVGMGNGLN